MALQRRGGSRNLLWVVHRHSSYRHFEFHVGVLTYCSILAMKDEDLKYVLMSFVRVASCDRSLEGIKNASLTGITVVIPTELTSEVLLNNSETSRKT